MVLPTPMLKESISHLQNHFGSILKKIKPSLPSPKYPIEGLFLCKVMLAKMIEMNDPLLMETFNIKIIKTLVYLLYNAKNAIPNVCMLCHIYNISKKELKNSP